MSLPDSSHLRMRAEGKFFRLGPEKFFVKGVAYGPFAPYSNHDFFPRPEQVKQDVAMLKELGANLLRVYHLPPRWLLDLALENGMKLLVDVPWNKHRCFLDSRKLKQEAREAVRDTVQATCGHPAIFAYSVVNEIPAEIVRWSGARAVEDFIDELVLEAKAVDPDGLCTFANFPPTEFLGPQNTDFVCFNIYLHERRAYERYLARLQMQADSKPLMIGEFGIDSIREGEQRKSEILSWQIESSFRGGAAGTVVFSFTDEWFKEGQPVKDWAFGLTTKERVPKPAFDAVQEMFHSAPRFPLSRQPKVSVVVATYNGGKTLGACLDSLCKLNYPNYEILLVDDGSTDGTMQITSAYPQVQYIRQTHLGLSVARNTGIESATGEIIAFTDSDCRADEDWLYYLVSDLVSSDFVGIGGPNYLPPEDSPMAAAVLASPGGPAHVMFNDRQAEHIPGCNMAFYKWALAEIGGFDPIFHQAGDDVDLCWRLQQRGFTIGFSPSGFVWHHRRSTPAAYLRQQQGYGEAEALLAHKHPEYFSPLGGSIWRGHIYSHSQSALQMQRPIIYHGAFGAGFFQSIYGVEPAWSLMLCTSLEYQVLVTLPLLLFSAPFPFLLPIALSSVLLSLGICFAAAYQANLPKAKKRFWSRPLVTLLFLLQPIVRGFARYRGRLGRGLTPPAARERIQTFPPAPASDAVQCLYYWTESDVDRLTLVRSILARLDQEGWISKADTGWCDYDVEVLGSRWSRCQITTTTEYLKSGQKMFRCRLRAFWSLPATLCFWAIAALELLAIGLFSGGQPYLWLLLPSLILLAWYLTQDNQNLMRILAAFLDDTAGELKLHKVIYDAEKEKFIPHDSLRPEKPDAKPGK
jgi:O-antigen biosynthesis protein